MNARGKGSCGPRGGRVDFEKPGLPRLDAHAVSLYLLRARILRRFRFSRRMRFFFHFPRICKVGGEDGEAGR